MKAGIVMQDKPLLRDFYRHQLRIYGFNRPIPSIVDGEKRFYKEVSRLWTTISRFLPFSFWIVYIALRWSSIIWDNLIFDIILANAVFWMLVLPLRWFFTRFERANEDGSPLGSMVYPDDLFVVPTKRRRSIGSIVSIVIFLPLILFMLANSFSAMYLRYLVESDPADVDSRMTASITKNYSPIVDLDAGSSGIAQHVSVSDITDTGYVAVELRMHKLPDSISVYLNRKLISSGQDTYAGQHTFYEYKSVGFIWDIDYFKQSVIIFPEGSDFILNGVNTLEVISGMYHRVWTFELIADRKN